MKERGNIDWIDQNILRVLSLYDHLTPLQVWFELGEDGLIRERVTEAEVVSRLESLRMRGLVETLVKARVGGSPSYIAYCVTSGVTCE